MIAVSNTSPLRYLIAAGQAAVLEGLFREILIPTGVAAELMDPAAPLIVREWITHPPAWLRITDLKSMPDVELVAALDRGEREAIQLASECHADILIIDEWKGRTVAKRRRIPLTGAIGILGEAYKRRLIHNPLEILAELRQHGFRISPALVATFELLLRTRYAPE